MPALTELPRAVLSHRPDASLKQTDSLTNRAIGELYSHTPLEFIWDKEWSFSILWNHGLAILERVGIGPGYADLPINHFRNTVIPPLSKRYHLLILVVTDAYFAILILAWNHSFPSTVEKLLWRISCVTCLCAIPLFLFGFEMGFEWWPQLRKRPLDNQRSPHESQAKTLPNTQKGKLHRPREMVHNIAERLRNNSTNHDPAMRAPLKTVLSTWVIGALYTFARAYILVEDIVELRSLEKSAYLTVEWSWYLPHVS